jgi:hypothetical protein
MYRKGAKEGERRETGYRKKANGTRKTRERERRLGREKGMILRKISTYHGRYSIYFVTSELQPLEVLELGYIGEKRKGGRGEWRRGKEKGEREEGEKGEEEERVLIPGGRKERLFLHAVKTLNSESS